MDRIPALILSKNRAPQLRLLLESLQFNATGIFDPYVIFTTTNPEFEKGYQLLISEKLGATFIRESYLLDNFYNFLNNFRDGNFALFMDDCIFYRPLRVTPEEITNKLDDKTWSVNLRVGNNTTDGNEKLNPISEDETFLGYNFKDHSAFSSYGFCFSWDGIVYNSQHVLNFFNGDQFMNTSNQWAILPQKIENFSTNHRDQIPQDIVYCPRESHVICMNYNSTHPMANFDAAPIDELNYRYLAGQVIDFNSINFNDIKGTHEVRPFDLRQIR